MKHPCTFEIGFLLLVIALSLTGFSSLFSADRAGPSAFQLMHIVTSLAWLTLLLTQLVAIRQRRFDRHRAIGMSVFFAAPVLVASMVLLSAHSAAKDAVLGRADVMVVQNVMVTLELALLVLLAFALRRNRAIHGALMLSTALLFMGIALFFTLISYVPGYRIEGPETFYRFAKAAQATAYAGGIVGLLFFARNWRTGWPWLLAGSFFFINGFVQMIVARNDGTRALTALVASIDPWPAFGMGLLIFSALLWMAWRVKPGAGMALGSSRQGAL
ncbi:MAG: hypothetical protein ABI650_09475 [Dokdonella sp.]